jgi:hypothetical protein
MLLNDRVRVLELAHAEREIPCIGDPDSRTSLVVDGRPILRGQSARLVLLGSRVTSLLEAEQSAGRTSKPECTVLRHSVSSHARERAAWPSRGSSWLYAVTASDGIVVTGIYVAGQRVLLERVPVALQQGTRIEIELLNPRTAEASAEIVLLTSVAVRASAPSRSYSFSPASSVHTRIRAKEDSNQARVRERVGTGKGTSGRGK